MILKGKATTIASRAFRLSTGWIGILIGLLAPLTLSAQGWQSSYGDNKTDEAFALVETLDEGYVTVGVSESFGDDNDPDIFVVRTDVDGNLIWREVYDLGFRETGTDIVRTERGTYLIVGTIVQDVGDDSDILLLEINDQGTLLWSRTVDAPFDQKLTGVAIAANGDYLVVGEEFNTDAEDSDFLLARFNDSGELLWKTTTGTGRADAANAVATLGDDFVITGVSKNVEGPDNDLVTIRIDGDGQVIWEQRLSSAELEEGRDVTVSRNGQVLVAGIINNAQDGLVVKMDAETGDTIWTTTIGSPLLENGLNAIVELQNRDLAVTGFEVQADGIDVGILVGRLSSEGEVLFTNRLGDQQYLDEGRDLIETASGDLVIAGYNGFELTFFNDLVLVKTDGKGNAFSNILTGRVYWDQDEQCDADVSESGLSDWIVQAVGQENTYFGTTDRNGFYEILVDTGFYTVDVLPVNRYWVPCLEDGVSFQLTEIYDTTRTDFGIQARSACPYLTVEVSAPFLARCSEVPYTVQYCNSGTATAEDVQIVLDLDDILTYRSSGVDPMGNENNTLTFSIGDVAPGVCTSFDVITASACEGIAVNQAVKVSATISPDTLCFLFNPDWDESDLEVTGQCEADSVAFSVINVGIKEMTTKRTAIVIEDDIIITSEPIELEANEERRIKVPANGSTYRVVAFEDENHPFSAYATSAVEGCSTDGSFSTGRVTQFPEDDQAPTRAINVQEILEEVPTVVLTGHPKGYRNGLIDRNDGITYRLVFTNTGQDTVNRVVIRDTIPVGLDPSTVVFGASSHPYRAEVYEDGILKITFEDNIALAPALPNDLLASQGYISYTIQQNPDNVLGTVIRNQSRIYFDYQMPVMSNAVEHEVGSFPGFVEVTSVEQPPIPGLKIQVFPNPFTEEAQFVVSGYSVQQLTLLMYDVNGRRVGTLQQGGSQLTYKRGNLPRGLYVFRLLGDGVELATGKLQVN